MITPFQLLSDGWSLVERKHIQRRESDGLPITWFVWMRGTLTQHRVCLTGIDGDHGITTDNSNWATETFIKLGGVL